MLPRWSFRYAAYQEEEDWDLNTLSRINNQLEMYIGRLPGGPGDLTLAELQEMASRQQQQIEAQQQVLVAKEQRLKYLKQQEARHAQLASESERLRRIRERVESQELKLKKLRALRGQAEQYRANNTHLNTELDSVKAVFNEKEKELAMAVTKVDQLTKQLKELRNGTVNTMLSGKKNAAAALELEKLRKELLIRNNLNEQQNNTISAKEKLLAKRKDEAANMDNRIQELQQRLKKRKLQEDPNNQNVKQAVNVGNKQNKSENKDGFTNNSGKNVYRVSPYIQYAPQDVAKDDSYTKSVNFTKQDPKYQTLPSNVKLTTPEMDTPNTRQEPWEMNNNNEMMEEYTLPAVLPMGKKTNFPPHGNNSQHPPPQPQHFQKMQRLNNNDLSKQNQNLVPHSAVWQAQNVKPSPDISNVSTRAASPRSINSPAEVKPSTAAGSVVGGDERHIQSRGNQQNMPGTEFESNEPNEHRIPSLHPVISISEEERQAGSGQSSPASSEGSSNASGGIQIVTDENGQNINTSSIGSVSAMIERLNKDKIASSAKEDADTPTAGTPPYSIPSSHSGANRPSDKTQRHKGGPDSQTTSSSSSSSAKQSAPNSSEPALVSGNPPSSSAHPPSLAPQLNLKPAQTYRYASKNQIANTYMGRLGSAAMEKYQQSLNKLYTNLDSTGMAAAAPQGSYQPEDGATKESQPAGSESESGGSGQAQFGVASPHDYPDIASDKGSYKLNTPKQVRRRHSDSENEDLNKALQEREKSELQRQSGDKNNLGTKYEPETKSSAPPQPVPMSNDKNPNKKIDEDKEKRDSPSLSSGGRKSDSAKAPAAKTQKKPKAEAVTRRTKSNLKKKNSRKSNNRVSFDPFALLLDASLEGELDLVKKVAVQVDDVSTPNDEGITALHNAICAGHFDIVKFLIEFGCDVNSPDSDGWTPLHCAASCNNLAMVRFLVEHGACVFATTISDQETAADKCEEEEDGYDGCSDYLYSIQEKLGITNNGDVFAVFDYSACNTDEFSFSIGDKLAVLKKGDDTEKEWWWAKLQGTEGYIPRNFLGLYPRVIQQPSEVSAC